MKCSNPNVTKCPGEIGGPYNECDQCGWRVAKSTAPVAQPKLEVPTPSMENK